MKRLMAMAAISVLVIAASPIAHAAKPTAELIDVHHILKAKQGKPGGQANCTEQSGPDAGTYRLTGWAVQGNKTAHFNTATTPSGLSTNAVSSALQAAFSEWAGAPSINVANDGTMTRYTANHSYDLLFGSTGGSIATTYTWRWSNGEIESDVVFNRNLGWFVASSEGDGCINDAGAKYDVENIATHEAGHVYGLDHPSGARWETMYAYGYTGETLKRSAAAGDRAGIQAVY